MEERENRMKDKEEMLLMDLEPTKKNQTKGQLPGEGIKIKKSSPGYSPEHVLGRSTHSKSHQHFSMNSYPIKSPSAGHHISSMAKSIDFGQASRNSHNSFGVQLTDSYSLRDKKHMNSIHETTPLVPVRSKYRSELRRNSLNSSENFSRKSFLFHFLSLF